MSGKMMGGVYEVELTHGQQSVLLAMADHAQDDGSDCFPAIGRIAWKSGYSERQVKRLVKELKVAQILIEVAPSGRRHPTEYRIDLSAAVAKEPYVPRGDKWHIRGDNSDQGGVTPTAGRGDTTASPEPSVEPSRGNNSNVAASPSSDEINEVWDHYVATMHPRRKTLDPDERKKIQDALMVGTAEEWKRAITACEGSDFHMKRGAYKSRPRKYNQLVSILHPRKRNGQTQRSRLDMWLDEAAKQGSGQTATFDVNAEAARLAAAQGLGR